MLQKIYSRFLSGSSKPQQSDEFTGCIDLPMSRFIKVICTGDLSYLGICVDKETLWQKIHSEYAELSGDTSSSRGLELAKQITFLTNRINITNAIISHLSIRRVDGLVEELKIMGYRLKFDDFEKDLQRVLSLSKSDHVKLANAQAAYKEIKTGDKTTEFMWFQILSSIAKYRQVAVINPALITVVEFIAMDKDFRNYIASIK